MKKIVAEKDKVINSLTSEGNKLSMNELKNLTIIKKLRSKEAESEVALAEQIKKIQAQVNSNAELNKEIEYLQKAETNSRGL